MRRTILSTLTSALALSASLAGAQADQTFTGKVSASMCGKKHMMQSETDAKCIRVCVKSGSGKDIFVVIAVRSSRYLGNAEGERWS